ncbi:MAG: glycosyltransferase family 39 protein [Anaerolineae bacterium]|nr:glycosyltransferase family 39 protein [Anaerolineae bacterium]
MQTILAWILVGLVIAAAYPAAARLLARGKRQDDFWLRAVVALGLSTGTLTLVMFWEALLGIRWSILGITLPYLVVMGINAIGALWRYSSLTSPPIPLSVPERGSNSQIDKPIKKENSKSKSWNWFSGILVLIVSGAIFFNAIYWPFHRDDVLGIYGKYGALMYESGTLVPFAGRDDAFYQAYPVHIPLAYTYTYLASGWMNEYLAGVIPALLSLGCLLAVYTLGRMLYSESAGVLAAIILALTSQFARWASSGYVDLPMAFYYTMAAIFLWRLWEDDTTIDAVLAGGALGFAAWTKNAALMGIVFAGLWLGYGWLKGQIRVKQIGLVVLVCGLISAPWYIRNYLEARLIVPPTAWTEQAERTLNNLMVFITQPENFGVTGWLVTIGIVGGIYATLTPHLYRQQNKQYHTSEQGHVLLLALSLPFFGVWWLLVSYDPRFLLLFLPLLVVLGSGITLRIWAHIPTKIREIGRWVMTIGAVIMAVYIVWISVEFKDEIIRDPFMGDADKRAIVMQIFSK